jgi:hypothetical protein
MPGLYPRAYPTSVPDPTLPFPPAEDPWAGRASVPQRPQPALPPAPPTQPIYQQQPPPPPPSQPQYGPDPGYQPQPQVIFVEVPRKRRWPWVLGIFVLLMLLCCGICTAIVAPLFGEYPSGVGAMPAQVGGLQKDTNGLTRLIEGEAVFRIRTSDFVDDAFAGNYLDPASAQRNAIFFGGTGLIWDPPGTMKAVVQGAGSLTEVTDFKPGPLGGQLKCANGTDDQGKAVVMCAWIDHGSLGVGLFYGGRAMPESAELTRLLRAAVIIRP